MSSIENVTTQTAIEAAKKIVLMWNGASSLIGKGSLIEYTQVTRVEPIVLIDADCLYLDCLSDVQQSLLSIFAGYYLQAVAISTNVGSVKVMRELDRLNPSRNVMASAANNSWMMAAESYKDGLPMYSKSAAMEDATEDFVKGFKDPKAQASSTEVSFGRDYNATLKELSNLSVGKMLNVEITDGKNKATIPVAVRLLATSIPTTSLVYLLGKNKEDNSAKERYHAWRAGRLSFIKDLVFCQDLIDAHRKHLMKDKSDVYSTILNRAQANKVSTIVSGNPSVATASNLIVMSNTTAMQIEMELNGKLSDFRTREKLFHDTYAMIIAVIDKQWERVTFYHRSIDSKTEVSARDLKAVNKGSGPDVSEILKAYRFGNSPSL